MVRSNICHPLFSKINYCPARNFSTGSLHCKQVPQNLKNKGASSSHWLTRQLNDPYVEKARIEHYRCRSAFKLLEINERFKILFPGQCIIECGAAPGSWTQVLVKHTNSAATDKEKPVGVVVAADLLPIYHIDGASLVDNADFTKPETQDKIRKLLDGCLADGVVSDMAPKSSGIQELDHDQIIELAYSVLCFAVQMSKVDAFVIVKLWDGDKTKMLVTDLSKFYSSVKYVKPKSSRTDSSELFLLARGFKGIKKG